MTIDNVDLGRSSSRDGKAIYVENTPNVVIQHCDLAYRHYGISVNGSSSNPIIQHNDFSNSGGNGDAALLLTSTTSIATYAVSNNTWGGAGCERLLELHTVSGVIVNDGSLSDAQIIIPDGVASTTTGTSALIIAVDNCSNITFDNIDLSASSGQSGKGFYVDDASNITIQNCDLQHRDYGAVYQTGCSNPIVQNNGEGCPCP